MLRDNYISIMKLKKINNTDCQASKKTGIMRKGISQYVWLKRQIELENIMFIIVEASKGDSESFESESIGRWILLKTINWKYSIFCIKTETSLERL